MIISCQHCGKRVRIDAHKYSGKRIKMRCSECREVVAVEVPLRNPSADNPTPADSPQILIAHSDPALCETIGGILGSHNFHWRSCHEGEAALQLMDTHPPQVAIIDVALPGLFAFEVVEKVRKRPGLENVKIMLLSSVYNKMAYKRRPSTLYGADDYIEKHHIPLDLIGKINKLMVIGHEIANKAEAILDDAPTPREVNELKECLQKAEEREGTLVPGDVTELGRAQRLARIIASDISLYDEAKVAEGIRTGRFFELFADEIAEGRQHFLTRVPESVPRRTEILDEAFNELIEHYRRELHP